MGSCRKRYIYAELRKNKRLNKGAALLQSLLLAIIVVLVIGAMYVLSLRIFRGSEEIKRFVSVREAAASGVNYAASMTNFQYNFLINFATNPCIVHNLQFQLFGQTGFGITEVTICRAFSLQTGGEEKSGASREPITGAGQATAVFKITAVSRFPANNPQQEARVEALYMR